MNDSEMELNPTKLLKDFYHPERVLFDHKVLTAVFNDRRAWLFAPSDKIVQFIGGNVRLKHAYKLVENAWFVVDDEPGKLTDKGKVKCTVDFDKQVDLKGIYVMSGLLNSHTHMGLVSDLKKKFPTTEASTTYAALRDLREALQ